MTTLLTPGGLPYPDGAEAVRDGDNAIGALAAAVDPYYVRCSGTDSRNIAAGAWTFVPTPVQDWVSGTGWTVDTNGPITTKSGVFLCVATLSIANALAGSRRVIGVSGSNGTAPTSTASATSAAYTGGGTAMILNGAWAVQYAAGARFALWVFHDAGTTLAVTTRSLSVTKIS